MKHSVLHGRFGTPEEFSDPDLVIPAGIFCVILGEDGETDGFKIGDGVSTYLDLPTFSPSADTEQAH